MKKVTLITVHGMGEEAPEYFLEFEAMLKKRLGPLWEDLSFQPVDYASVLQSSQNSLWKKMTNNSNNKLSWEFLRKFILFGFGDAGTLEHSASHNSNKYVAVELKIQEALGKAFADTGNNLKIPVVIIAHSLGCQVISNYLWDAQENNFIFTESEHSTAPLKSFERLESLQNLITVGCNIPIFNAGIENRVCFSKPNTTFKWDNFYDPDDILGWPLNDLGESYTFIKDRVVNLRGWFSWSPLAHEAYWTDPKIIDHVANILKGHLL